VNCFEDERADLPGISTLCVSKTNQYLRIVETWAMLVQVASKSSIEPMFRDVLKTLRFILKVPDETAALLAGKAFVDRSGPRRASLSAISRPNGCPSLVRSVLVTLDPILTVWITMNTQTTEIQSFHFTCAGMIMQVFRTLIGCSINTTSHIEGWHSTLEVCTLKADKNLCLPQDSFLYASSSLA
jgi:hypothetical protein